MMFDANAAHIKCGDLFFAEIHAVDNQLESAGLKVGDIILCEYVEKDNERPRNNLVSKFWVTKDSDPREWRFNASSDDWSWMVYSGRPNGSGFINEKWKQKALAFLNGEWIK